jgi:hypothetical protein
VLIGMSLLFNPFQWARTQPILNFFGEYMIQMLGQILAESAKTEAHYRRVAVTGDEGRQTVIAYIWCGP